MRLGIDHQGRPGVRRRKSREVLSGVACAQPVAGSLEGIIDASEGSYTPGTELVIAVGSDGHREIVTARRPGRGRRSERVHGSARSATVAQVVQGRRFELPPTAFWQSHVAAPEYYTAQIARLLAQVIDTRQLTRGSAVGWDLYGGVGLFVPALAEALGADAQIHTVDSSPSALLRAQPALQEFRFVPHKGRVEEVISRLPSPHAVVLDPPRQGAGAQVVSMVAEACPQAVVHVGCDPATLARDLASWRSHGYTVESLTVVDAFPGTHHCEVLALLQPGIELR